MTPDAFVAKWKRTNLSERSAAHQHFLDLCELFNHPKPAEEDPEGERFTFERGARKSDGKKGWADVWKRDFFAWEYKRKDKHKSLGDAYQQLLLYREDLENPPLLVVSDIGHTEIHTNFTRTAKRVYRVDLGEIAQPEKLDWLRKVFTNPDALRPGQTTEAVTLDVADRFARLADGIRRRRIPMPDAARFLMKLMFCMFAERIDLLPEGVFRKVLVNYRNSPGRLAGRLKSLFETMARGGDFGEHSIQRFNGGLFADTEVVELTPDEIAELIRVNECDWGNVEPSIFGTLLERTIDPEKRAQVGTHYTSRQDVLTLLEPVLVAPLRREWEAVRQRCEELWVEIQRGVRQDRAALRRKDSKPRREFDKLLLDFVERLASVTVLDPACGSGNFLYVAIHRLLDLEKAVIAYASHHDTNLIPQVSPRQLAGIEINPYARHLAQVVMWIGHLQWKHQNGFAPPRDPVLDPVDGIREADAILDLSDPQRPREPEWPEAEFIVGNLPFLGGKKMRKRLGDEYVDSLFAAWQRQVRREADLCCYWFEKARRYIEAGKCKRAGLLATQGIRGGANQNVLKRIKETGDIFFAESDRDWVLEGAAVRVSMVCFDDGSENERSLDNQRVSRINSDLTYGVDVTRAKGLAANRSISFMGDTKGNKFEIPEEQALQILFQPNPNGRPNSDVLVPWINGRAVTRRERRKWIIDFGTDCGEEQAALYEIPFEFVRVHVYPKRQKNKREAYRQRWWLHAEARPGMRNALKPLARFIATTEASRHGLFVWEAAPTLPDHQLRAYPNNPWRTITATCSCTCFACS